MMHAKVDGGPPPVDTNHKGKRPLIKRPAFIACVAILAVVVAVVGGLAFGPAIVSQADRIAAGTPAEPGSAAPETARKQVPVVLTPARQMTFESRIVVSGSVDAKRYALVSARIPGTLDAVYVDEGDRVEAGKTKLFQTDSLKLTKAVAIAKQDLTVAQCSVQEKQALLEKDRAAQSQAQNDVNRYRELVRRNAVAVQILEEQEEECKQCDADVKHTQALIDLAGARSEQARLNLTIAEKDQADSLVLAPISGRVSQRLREPGEMAGAGTPVLRIEDLALLEVSVFLPEAYYAEIVPGETTMRVRVGDVELGDRRVDYKSPTVHSKLRTFEVKGLVESPSEGVVPGCLAEVTIVAHSREGVGVPAEAVQTRGDRSVLFTVEGDRAKMIPVKTGRDMEGWIEILDGVAAGTPVVSMGQTLVDDGTPISVVEEDVQ
ncbi:MAG TPA: efflux RND transporter periplasmic adaptor subunit [Thermoguttaceae bacterium]|nr:efflux RND transporter periplasmic adaptor subunit [Thermoguttaceae bacterium]